MGCCTQRKDRSDYIKREKFLGSLRNYLAKYYSPVWNDSVNYLINGGFKKINSTYYFTIPIYTSTYAQAGVLN
jgi:hypothetical protein